MEHSAMVAAYEKIELSRMISSRNFSAAGFFRWPRCSIAISFTLPSSECPYRFFMTEKTLSLVGYCVSIGKKAVMSSEEMLEAIFISHCSICGEDDFFIAEVADMRTCNDVSWMAMSTMVTKSL